MFLVRFTRTAVDVRWGHTPYLQTAVIFIRGRARPIRAIGVASETLHAVHEHAKIAARRYVNYYFGSRHVIFAVE